MRREDPNREYLLIVADAIGDLCNEIVFVGGSVAGLLLTDAVADGVRATKDVDAVVEATTLSQYHQWVRPRRAQRACGAGGSRLSDRTLPPSCGRPRKLRASHIRISWLARPCSDIGRQ